jgi:hypothetical protein
MTDHVGSLSFYFFDIDDNLPFLPTGLYLWNAERKIEQSISSGDFAAIQNDLGRKGKGQPWAIREETFRDFRDRTGVPADGQAAASTTLHRAISTKVWRFQTGRRKESHFFQRYGLLFLIDTGMIHGVDERENSDGALHIASAARDQKATVICADGEQKTIWSKDSRDYETEALYRVTSPFIFQELTS